MQTARNSSSLRSPTANWRHSRLFARQRQETHTMENVVSLSGDGLPNRRGMAQRPPVGHNASGGIDFGIRLPCRTSRAPSPF
jgi:hypothetical protein